MNEPTIGPVDLPELTLTVTRAGRGPAVVLLHGFPEIAYSWRHQVGAFAEAGYSVVAPDQRGYGWSDGPEDVESYAITELVGDVIALLDHDGIDRAVVVGHDWGAMIAPWVALFRPDRVKGLALLSVPYAPRGDQSLIDRLRATDPDGRFAYVLAFQEPGVEALFETDPLETLRRIHWTASGARSHDLASGDEVPPGLPPHLTAGDLENYYRAFARSGFARPIDYYRNIHRNWERSRPWHGMKLDLPVVFVAGDRDFVVANADGTPRSSVDTMRDWCSDLRGVHLIEGAGHWVQQEAPDRVNAILVDFFDSLEA